MDQSLNNQKKENLMIPTGNNKNNENIPQKIAASKDTSGSPANSAAHPDLSQPGDFISSADSAIPPDSLQPAVITPHTIPGQSANTDQSADTAPPAGAAYTTNEPLYAASAKAPGSPLSAGLNFIFYGLILNLLTFNFLNLNYILPAIGTILMLIGFRQLGSENTWFKKGWILTSLRAPYLLFLFSTNATILYADFSSSSFSSIPWFLNVIIMLSTLFCLSRGINAIQQKRNQPLPFSSPKNLILWYAAACVLAFLQISGLILWVPMLIAFIITFRNLFRLSRELAEAGYTIPPAPIRLSNGMFFLLMIGILGLCIACGYLFFQSYPMEWTSLAQSTESEQSEFSKIKSDLTASGFPENVLNDLTPEEIKACAGAKRILTKEEDHPVNEGRQVTSNFGNYYQTYTVYDVEELRITEIAVELPGDQNRWKIFHHFLWTVNPGFFGTEAIHLDSHFLYKDGNQPSNYTGRVLYDKKGQTYTAPYYSIGDDIYEAGNIPWNNHHSDNLFLAFSLPSKGERQRGYIAYDVDWAQGDLPIRTWMNYIHQQSRTQYPVLTAQEFQKIRISGGWGPGNAFFTVQSSLQFRPSDTKNEL